MPDNNQDLLKIPKHDIKVKASVEERSLLKDISKSALEEVVVPKTKEVLLDFTMGLSRMALDTISTFIKKYLYPNGDAPTRNNGTSYTGITNYTSYSRPINSYQPQSQKSRDVISQRSGCDVKYIWVESEEKAKLITETLREDIGNYGKAKVATLYEMVGIRTSMTDFKYGWTDYHSIGYYYDSSRHGDENKWFLDLSKPVELF